jgi:hypothetical protein
MTVAPGVPCGALFIAKITLGVAEIACLAAMPEIGT